jgi:tetratricopeptide (TPR) repeat protein
MAKTPLKTTPPEPAAVVENYRVAANSRPDDPEPQIDLGWGLYGAGKYAEAVEQFKRVLSMTANSVDAEYGLGLSQKALGNKEAAVAAFNQVASLAVQLEDHVRGTMLKRLAHGHVNEINSGDWKLEKEIWQRES